jgi:hypothetical protein
VLHVVWFLSHGTSVCDFGSIALLFSDTSVLGVCSENNRKVHELDQITCNDEHSWVCL